MGLRFGALALCASIAGAQTPAVEDLRIVGVTVIDGTGAAPAVRTVVVRNGRIAGLLDADAAAAGEPAREVDGRGRWLVPGLWDMHVHMTAIPGFAALYVHHGVTGVRDMFGLMAQIVPLRRAILAGERTGPRIVAAGRIVDGEQPVWSGSVEVLDADAGRSAVDTVAGEGSEFVKVYSKLSRPAYCASAQAARARGIPFAGHVPRSVTVAEAAAAGQRSIEHLTGVLEECSTEPERARDRSLPKAERLALLVDTFDDARCKALAGVLVEHGTWMCPTLTVLRAVAHLDDPTFTADTRVRQLPPFVARMWDPKNDARFADTTPAVWEQEKRVYARTLQAVGILHRAGVRMLAGTDVGNPYCFPGSGLHDELALLVQAGLSPHEALSAATRNPAEYLGLQDERGTIAEGKVADLVLLEADPLADIRNTTKIAAVVLEGRLFDRSALDALVPQATK
jgi:imidazolonepropionase-like amidohydrolase